MDDQIFVSYSRNQLYFAEDCVNALQEQGLDIWFDLQQLEAGTEWAAEIKSGLEASAGVVLIASQAALHSPYVTAEWMHALENDMPVYLVLFEAVDFEPYAMAFEDEEQVVPLDELHAKASAIIDARHNFKANINRLHECISGTAAYRDPVPKSNRFNLPTRLPIAVAFIVVTMVALTLIAGYLTVTFLTAFIPTTIVGFITVAFLGRQTWAFLQRSSFRGTRITLVIAPPILFVFAPWFLPIALIALYLSINSDDVHRMSPPGQGNNPRDLIQRGKRPIWLQIPLLPSVVVLPLSLTQG